jgi:hypothetical protein
MFKRLLLLVALALPLATWAFVKPVRVLAPEFVGLSCVGKVCVDDPSRRTEAEVLYKEAVQYVQSSVGALQSTPRIAFCSTLACSQRFGFTHSGAYNVATVGIVISHRGWHPYYVRHELIHHLQNEHLGSATAWLFKPDWFKEGMAYSLSQDPRKPLPEPLQGYRSKFESWFKQIGPEKLWAEAATL